MKTAFGREAIHGHDAKCTVQDLTLTCDLGTVWEQSAVAFVPSTVTVTFYQIQRNDTVDFESTVGVSSGWPEAAANSTTKFRLVA
mgnify:CR=1 FL=1